MKILILSLVAFGIVFCFTPLPEILGRAIKRHAAEPVQAIVHADGLDAIPMATSPDALHDFTALCNQEDNLGKLQLQAEGKIFRVNDRTRVTVLSNGSTACRIRVAEGEYEGKTAYVYSEWITR
jgi:hypothetical protein